MNILIESEDIFLRDVLKSDIDLFLYWMTSGEWRHFDAPWEGIHDRLSEEEESNYRNFFGRYLDNPLEHPRKQAYICLKDGKPVGRVNRYGNDRFPEIYYLGISIFVDDHLEKGLGTQALQAWINYLLKNSDAHKLEVHTWSLNPRMIRVAEKLGFKHEGTERELIQWQGEWQDRLRFGLLREEWEAPDS